VEAIQKGDRGKLLSLGVATSADINFKINNKGVFPLLLAAALGK